APVATPVETPLTEDLHDRPIHGADRAALVAGHVQVDRGAPGVEGQTHRRVARDEPRHVATAVLTGVDGAGQAPFLDLLQRPAQLRDHRLVAGHPAEDRNDLGADVLADPAAV